MTKVWGRGRRKRPAQAQPKKDAQVAGTLVNGSGENYPARRFAETGVLVNENNGCRQLLMEPEPRGSMGLGGISAAAGLARHEHSWQ